MPRVQMHFAANTARKMRIFAAIFNIAQNRVTNGRHMHTQLVRAPCEREQLNPANPSACMFQHTVTGASALPLHLINKHFFAAAARLFRERQVNLALTNIGQPHYQRPIGFAR